MLTAGVDMATEPAKTGLATIRWDDDVAVLTELDMGVSDDTIAQAVAVSAKVGIDCPLGWPDAFVEMLSVHHDGHVAPHTLDDAEWRRRLANRGTDLAIYRSTGIRPLSVAADRISLTAMRTANLLGGLSAAGSPVDRAGTGVVVEVYPAASLKRWELPHRGYKGDARTGVLETLVDDLMSAAPWLRLGQYEHLCRRRDDALDAVVAALTARAAARGLTAAPAADERERARREGWIAVPTVGLDALRPDRATPHERRAGSSTSGGDAAR